MNNLVSAMLGTQSSNKMGELDIIGEMAPEVARLVLMRLSKEDTLQAWKCSLKWKAIMSDKCFFKNKYKKDFSYQFGFLEEDQNTKSYEKLYAQFSHHWQSAYLSKSTIASNWKNGRRRVKQISGDDDVATRHQDVAILRDEKLLTIMYFVEDDRVVHLTDPSTGEKKKFEAQEHEKITNVCIAGNLLFYTVCVDQELGSENLMAWNMQTKEEIICIQKFIRVIGFYKPIVYGDTFCLIDHNNTLFYYKEKLEKRVFEYVLSVYLYKNLAVITTYGFPRVINLDNDEIEVLRMECCELENFWRVEAWGKFLLITCSSGHLSTWNIEERVKLANNNSLEINACFSTCFMGYNRIILNYPTTWDTAIDNIVSYKLCVLEVSTLKHLFDIAEDHFVSQVIANSYYIFSNTYYFRDGMNITKMWDTRNGQFLGQFDVQPSIQLGYNLCISNSKAIISSYLENEESTDLKSKLDLFIKVYDYDIM